MADNVLTPETKGPRHLFKKSLPMQVALHEALRSLGNINEQTCLDIGVENGMVSYYLRKRGGVWHTAVGSEAAAASVRAIVNDNVCVLPDITLPFKKQMFDAVVIFGYLERVRSDESLIEECHRVLKPDGRLIVIAARVKTWTILEFLRSVMGLTYEEKGLVRPGYTESQLFNILKHGFDVHNIRTFSRFFVELTDSITQSKAKRKIGKENSEKKLMRLYSIANIFYRLADQLDVLLFLTKGHYLIAIAKRRAWRPRNAPVLVDGRSISEAVLTKALE